ncbi:NAD(P)H-binding protein [Bdellovibrio sp. ArHS]|uniref:NAD(P)H-binding protein n=1 Tax=Bdellovibrio sp. ArHS TaxID=1569284 RepID=UPI0025BBB1D6|nr:NAD(P)H-binding protein [Bdellovibrio sp. ArHS]
MKIAVAGASGFVGKALIRELQKKHEVVALSRSVKKSQNNGGVEWRSCDLFSLLDAENALKNVDVAVYLVHSMRPSAHLTQGTFDDFDLIVADNFVRAAEKNRVKQIIYLGGMRPDNASELSRHLRSRWEVEEVFKTSSIPATVLRAAIILGPEGSSFQMMARLVTRLPLMICPSWTDTVSQPISLNDVVHSIEYCVENEVVYNKVFDIGGPVAISYREMMQKIADKMGLQRRLLRFPFVTPQLSTLWVCLVTQAPWSLVSPLVRGLRHNLLIDPLKALKIPGHPFADVDLAINEALVTYDPHKKPLAFKGTEVGKHVVRSVQRLPLPPGKSAESVARAYLDFLPTLPAFLKVDVEGKWVYFRWRFPDTKLLILEYAPDRSWSHRQLFYVRGGLLAAKTERGRLEFREILGGQAVIAAIHDFVPRMPWYIYRWTQAYFHLWVMKQFGRYLKSGKSRPTNRQMPRPS